jgi:hypothetical protein
MPFMPQRIPADCDIYLPHYGSSDSVSAEDVRFLTRPQEGSSAAEAKAAPRRLARKSGAILIDPNRVSSRNATAAHGIRFPARCMKLVCTNAAHTHMCES